MSEQRLTDEKLDEMNEILGEINENLSHLDLIVTRLSQLVWVIVGTAVVLFIIGLLS